MTDTKRTRGPDGRLISSNPDAKPKVPTRPSMRQAINAMCKGCIYDNRSAGTWREQVAACSSSNCPLYVLRPLPRSNMPADELAALRAKLDSRNQG